MNNFKKTFGTKGNHPKFWDSLRSPIDIYTAMEEVWKAALEWVKKEAISLDERGNMSRNIINRELEE